MDDLINKVIEFAKDNEYEICVPKEEHSEEEINTIRIVSKEKIVYFEIE